MNKLHKSLIWLVLLSVAATSAAAEDVIVESRRGGKNFDRYQELVGVWSDSNTPAGAAKSSAAGLSPGSIGSRKFMLSGGKAAVARFFPMFTVPGYYKVYVTWPKGANAANVSMVVRHSRGDTVNKIDQDGYGADMESNADSWQSIGEYNFNSGKDQYVEIRVPGKEVTVIDAFQSGQVYADGVKFEPAVGGNTSAAPVPTSSPTDASLILTESTGPTLPSNSIFVESRPQGSNSSQYKEISGKWQNSGGTRVGQGKSTAPGLTPGNKCGTRKLLFSSADEAGLPAVARFLPNVKTAGTYEVFVTWPREGNAKAVTYVIQHAKGRDVKTQSQDGWAGLGVTNANQWISLGSFDFTPGDQQQFLELRVESIPETMTPNGTNIVQVFADGAAFVPK